MALPPVVLDPPFNVLRISHIELNVTDLAASKKFYGDTLGLALTDESDERLYFRAMEERSHHCVVLVKQDQASVAAMGYRVWSEEDLDKAHKWFSEQGRDVAWVERAYQGRTLRTSDNAGMPIELHYEMDRLPTIHQQYAQYKGVKPLRIDHFNCFSTNVDEATAFYHKMGFRTTEYTADEEPAPCGLPGCIARGACMTSPLPTAAARACTTRRSGSRHRSTSSTCWI